MHHAQRRQPRSTALEVAHLGVQPQQHRLDPGIALAAQATQFEHLLGVVAAPLAEAAAGGVAQRLQRAGGRARQQFALSRQQLLRQRRFQRRQAAALQRGSIAADPCSQRVARRQRIDARHRQLERLCDLAPLAVQLGGHCDRCGQRVGQDVGLVEHDEAFERVLAQVLGPDGQVGARHAGVGGEQEDDGMRGRQQPQRELGLGTDGVEPRRIDDHQPALQQGVRIVDQRVAPGRHLDTAVVQARRVVLRMLVAPEAQRRGGHRADATRLRHQHQRLGQAVGVARVQAQALPGLRAERAVRPATARPAGCRSAAAPVRPAGRHGTAVPPGTWWCVPVWPAARVGRCRRRRWR